MSPVSPSRVKQRTQSNSASIDAKLLAEAANVVRTLDELTLHRAFLGEEPTKQIASTVVDVRRRLARKDLAVAVIGEKKAGKSTFLNAILGAKVLGAENRECTAAVTYIRRTDFPVYRATLKGGGQKDFVDLEANQRDELANKIHTVRQRVHNPPAPRAIGRGMDNAQAAVSLAATRHVDASQIRFAAETQEAAWKSRRAAAEAEIHTHIVERDNAQRRVADIARQLSWEQSNVEQAERFLSQVNADLSDQSQRCSLVLQGQPYVDGRTEAMIGLDVAEEGVATATAALPYFMRPLPWWAFWMVFFRLLFGWMYGKASNALEEARASQRSAKIALNKANVAHRIEESKREENQREHNRLVELQSSSAEHTNRLAECRKSEAHQASLHSAVQ